MQALSSLKFLSYYNEYYDKIYRYLYYRSNNDHQVAEDLASETFLKAFEKKDSYDTAKPFSAWIYTIAHNCLIDSYRHNDKYKHNSIEENEIDLESQEDVAAGVNQKLTHNQILHSIKKLPEKFQEILILKYFNHYTNKEIEAMLDLNPNTLRTNIHRATAMLREFIPPLTIVFISLITS